MAQSKLGRPGSRQSLGTRPWSSKSRSIIDSRRERSRNVARWRIGRMKGIGKGHERSEEKTRSEGILFGKQGKKAAREAEAAAK